MKEYGFILFYFLIIAAVSVAVTVYDKSAAKLGKRRVPEKALFLFGFLGGALPMLLTMKAIRHKTKHKRFMLGLPAIILLHLIIAVIFILNNDNGGSI